MAISNDYVHILMYIEINEILMRWRSILHAVYVSFNSCCYRLLQFALVNQLNGRSWFLGIVNIKYTFIVTI